jgi:phosphonopyruvate decarboxylase
LIVTLRGELGGPPDEPQHALMGPITTRMLEAMEIPWEYFPTEATAVEASLDRVDAYALGASRPYALVMRKDSVRASPAPQPPPAQSVSVSTGNVTASATSLRHEFLRAVQAQLDDQDLLIATTGHTGRELNALDDRPNQFYMVGSMGCASSFGLGVALAQPRRRVIVLDGDGATLMRLGALAAIGNEAPPNLTHIVFDNGMHESTGGQAIARPGVDFAAIAAALGYRHAGHATTPQELLVQLGAPGGPRLIQVAVVPGTLPDLPRPRITPPEVANRLRATLAAGCKP